MSAAGLSGVAFARPQKGSFHETVAARVQQYLKANHISPYANTRMWVKTIVMMLMYFVPYLFMVTGTGSGNLWIFFLLWFLMAWGMIGIGTSIMHDAHHGTYSPKRKVNAAIGFILEIIGGFSVTWKIQHNQLHHTYTNIAGLDEDLDTMTILRFSPQQPRKWYHRYQHLYVWFFYGIMTLFWMTAKDYIQAIRYRQHDLLTTHHLTLRQAIFRITLYKLFYYAYIIVLPILFAGVPWYFVILGFLFMHFVAGVFLSCIFQPSHIVEASEFALPVETDGKKEMEESWAVHEVENTTDFAPHNRMLTWLIGGLNFQIEHHLFTNICHVHYPKLAPIVKNTARDFGIEYHVEPSWWDALKGHVKMLKRLGREDTL